MVAALTGGAVWSDFCAAFWGRFSEYLLAPRYNDISYCIERLRNL